MAFKIALTAGHYMGTAGKRCMKKLDPNETREWWLNDRIADKIEKLLQGYTGWELIRTDDTTGKKDISLQARTNAANNFKADFYLSIHHNAGVNGGKGGGIVAYRYTNTKRQETLDWQRELYDALIEATGLRGNRATPLAKANFHEVRVTVMPAVLLELGFMDSATDVPIILTEKFADQCAAAIVKVLVKRGKLTAKEAAPAQTCTVTLPVLKKGDKNESVRSMQSLLLARGYKMENGGKVYGADASFGGATVNGVSAYQKAVGLEVTGICDQATWSSLLGIK